MPAIKDYAKKGCTRPIISHNEEGRWPLGRHTSILTNCKRLVPLRVRPARFGATPLEPGYTEAGLRE